MHIAIVLFDGFDTLDAIGPFEVFNHAQTFGAELEVGLYTLTSPDGDPRRPIHRWPGHDRMFWPATLPL